MKEHWKEQECVAQFSYTSNLQNSQNSLKHVHYIHFIFEKYSIEFQIDLNEIDDIIFILLEFSIFERLLKFESFWKVTKFLIEDKIIDFKSYYARKTKQ